MRWLKLAMLSLFLTACQLKQPDFRLPQAVDFQGKTYTQATHNQLDKLQQLLYLPTEGKRDPNDWQQGVLFFLDKTDDLPLQTRLENRQKAYANQRDTTVKMAINNAELQSEIIYPPTERFHDVQLEVTRGRNLACGYGQMQFSQKLAVKSPSKRSKNSPNFTANDYLSALNDLAEQFARLPWLVECH